MSITPKCPVLLSFPTGDKSFNVKELVISLEKWNVNVHILRGNHGFSDPFSKNYCTQSFEEAGILVNSFLKKINYVSMDDLSYFNFYYLLLFNNNFRIELMYEPNSKKILDRAIRCQY